jgi:hypothetical protein
MKFNGLLAYLLFGVLTLSIWADETFLTELNEVWNTHNATNVLHFLNEKLAASSNDPQILFARANAALEMENWARGATNYVHQSINAVALSPDYNAENRAILLAELNLHLNFFEITVDFLAEPNPSYPQTNILVQTEMFQLESGEFPYIEFLQKFDELKEPN